MIVTKCDFDRQSFSCCNRFQHSRHITVAVVHRLDLVLQRESFHSDHDDRSAEFFWTCSSWSSSADQKYLFVRFDHQSNSQIVLQQRVLNEIKSSASLSFHSCQYSDLDLSNKKNQTKTKNKQISKSISRKWSRKKHFANMNSLSFLFSDNSRATSINRKLFILQYNVHKLKNVVMTTFLRDSAIKKFDIIVIQKFWINVYANIIHHSLKDNHFLFYSNQIEMQNLVRICIFVIKRIFIEDLKYLFRSKKVMIVQIRLHEFHFLHLHNIYNESNILSFFVLQNLRFVLKSSSKEQFRDHIIMKNLNIHHSSWEDVTARSDNKSFEMLLMMNESRLQFNLSRKTSTYFHFQRSESIIDMCLTIESLNDRILICKARFDLNHDSNHFLIETILNISISETTFFERFNWDRLNMKKFKRIFNYLLFDSSSQFFNAVQIDVYIKSVCNAIAEVRNAFISKFKTCDSRHLWIRRSVQSDTNSIKSSSKNVSRRARRSEQHRADAADVKKS
jgi:hypothetical protein